MNSLYRKITSRVLFTYHRRLLSYSATPKKEPPIKFSTTKASVYDSIDTFFNREYRKRPRGQRLIVSVSTALFMVYFCILRRENDVDDWLYRPHPSVPLPYGQTYEQVLKEYEKNVVEPRAARRFYFAKNNLVAMAQPPTSPPAMSALPYHAVKSKLSDKAAGSVAELSALCKLVLKGSGSQDLLTSTAKSFASLDRTMESSSNALQKTFLLSSQLCSLTAEMEKQLQYLDRFMHANNIAVDVTSDRSEKPSE